jgi:hypothetical protein
MNLGASGFEPIFDVHSKGLKLLANKILDINGKFYVAASADAGRVYLYETRRVGDSAPHRRDNCKTTLSFTLDGSDERNTSKRAVATGSAALKQLEFDNIFASDPLSDHDVLRVWLKGFSDFEQEKTQKVPTNHSNNIFDKKSYLTSSIMNKSIQQQ